jgi:hypothetical protein
MDPHIHVIRVRKAVENGFGSRLKKCFPSSPARAPSQRAERIARVPAGGNTTYHTVHKGSSGRRKVRKHSVVRKKADGHKWSEDDDSLPDYI